MTKTSPAGVDGPKELMFEGLNSLLLHWLLTDRLPRFLRFFFSVSDVWGAKKHRPGIFLKLQRKF